MKKYALILLIALSVTGSTIHADDNVDTVAFWSTVSSLLARDGYDQNSPFGKHAQANLRRVQTLRSGQSSLPFTRSASRSQKSTLGGWADTLGFGSSKHKPEKTTTSHTTRTKEVREKKKTPKAHEKKTKPKTKTTHKKQATTHAKKKS